MIKLGITGNIGSGKSTIARIFSILGVPVYDADSRAKALMVHNAEVVNGIINLLGKEAYKGEGNLDRNYISQKVFNNPELLQKLNGIVHPAVFKDFDDWVITQDTPYILKEAALLVESGSFKTLDYLIVVTANEDTRLQRSMNRDHVEESAIRARMKSQMPQEEKVKLADFVIDNDNALLIPQVLKIHRQVLKDNGA